MESLLNLVQTVCDELKTNSGVASTSFIKKYPGVTKSAPLASPVVSVGIAGLEVGESQLGGADEKKARVKIELLVCIPFFGNSSECSRIMQKLFEYLLFSSTFDIAKCSFGDISAKRETGAYELKGIVELSTTLTKAVSANGN